MRTLLLCVLLAAAMTSCSRSDLTIKVYHVNGTSETMTFHDLPDDGSELWLDEGCLRIGSIHRVACYVTRYEVVSRTPVKN